MKHPIRLEICKLLDEHTSLTTQEIQNLLEQTYTNEKQIYAVNDHILSLRAVGIVEMLVEWVEDKDNEEILMQRWGLTKFGREKYLKYW